jgi:hypothetical protein
MVTGSGLIEIARGLSLWLSGTTLFRTGTFILPKMQEKTSDTMYMNISTILSSEWQPILTSDFETFSIKNLRTVSMQEVIPKNLFDRCANELVETAVGKEGHINIHMLKTVFSLGEREVVDFVTSVYRGNYVETHSMLRSRLEEGYKKKSETNLRFTKPYTLTYLTPTEVHGKFASNNDEPYSSPTMYLDSLSRMLKYMCEQTVRTCCICTGIIFDDDIVLRLGCSHTFHSNTTETCDGIEHWLKNYHRCPICRAAV